MSHLHSPLKRLTYQSGIWERAAGIEEAKKEMTIPVCTSGRHIGLEQSLEHTNALFLVHARQTRAAGGRK